MGVSLGRLPTPGGDDGEWGQILNNFLSEAHDPTTGSLKTNSVGTTQLQDNAVTNAKVSSSAAIAKSKLASDVQTSLGKADTAAQLSANASDAGKAIDAYSGSPFSVTSENINSVASAGTSETLPDVTTATIHRLVLDANCALTFPTAAAGKAFTLVLVQDNNGSRTVTWPGSILWASGIIPTLTTTANKQDMFSFICVDGTNWMGLIVGQGF